MIPAVKVVAAITKFVELQPMEDFYTPPSSPKHSEDDSFSTVDLSLPSPPQRKGRRGRKKKDTSDDEHVVDPFFIPNGYKWVSFDDVKGCK